MPATKSTRARFIEATPLRREDGVVGVQLGFEIEGSRTLSGRIDDFADLGPELTVPAVGGLGKVLRILRAARIAAPSDPLELVGDEKAAAALLGRAAGTLLRLELKPRFRMRFVAWTEAGVETVDDITEVVEHEDAFLVHCRRGRFPKRFSRESVIRQQTEHDRWYEVTQIEPA